MDESWKMTKQNKIWKRFEVSVRRCVSVPLTSSVNPPDQYNALDMMLPLILKTASFLRR